MRERITDKMRLDWLTRNRADLIHYQDKVESIKVEWCCASSPYAEWHSTPRAAIDDAIRLQRKRTKDAR